MKVTQGVWEKIYVLVLAVRDSTTPLYGQVCGRITGYQIGSPDTFIGGSIDSHYMDGISVTHGSPRQHIWSFVGGINERILGSACPRVTGSTSGTRIPLFVGQSYFCESGITRYVHMLMVIPCGMDRGVAPIAAVAPSTYHRGLM